LATPPPSRSLVRRSLRASSSLSVAGERV